MPAPTVVTKTVKPGGGGDYLTLQAWWTAQKGNLPALNEIHRAVVYSGGNASSGGVLLMNESGSVSDDTCYYDIVVADGHDHDGKWDTTYAYFASTGEGFQVLSQVVHVTGLQIQGGMGNLGIYTTTVASGHPATHVVCKRCLIQALWGAGADGSGAITVDFHNCQIRSRAASGQFGVYVRGAGTAYNLYNCTVVCPGTGSTVALYVYSNAVVTSQNCYLKAATCYKNDGGGGTFNKGANDATSTTEATTVALRSVAFTTDNFVDVTGDLDLHVKPGSVLVAHGADLSATIDAVDIDNQARPCGDTWDIGMDEVVMTATSITPETDLDLGGAALTIYGTNFRAGTTVKIGAASATSVVVVSATEITCTAPPNAAGVYDVTVTGPDNETATLTAAFTYTLSVVYLPVNTPFRRTRRLR